MTRAAALLLAGALLGGPVLAQQEIIATNGNWTVADGDTLTVAGRPLRLHGIDAPEPEQTCRWAGGTVLCGAIARTALLDLLAGAGRVVCLPTGTLVRGIESARCAADGFDLSANMVHTGWALPTEAGEAGYGATRDAARAGRRGLWRGDFMRPWDWRARR